MKKVVFTLVVLCLSLMTQSACSGKSAKAEQATEQSGSDEKIFERPVRDRLSTFL